MFWGYPAFVGENQLLLLYCTKIYTTLVLRICLAAFLRNGDKIKFGLSDSLWFNKKMIRPLIINYKISYLYDKLNGCSFSGLLFLTLVTFRTVIFAIASSSGVAGLMNWQV